MELKEFFCKCCTAPLDPGKAVGRVIRCVHCGTYFTMAKESEPKVQNFLNQAEHDLDTCKFDEAYTAYQKAAELDKEEPEAYFGMALSTFKVQYLKDETSDPPRLQPICHEISEKSFFLDKNYLRALELASKEQKRVYREKAAEIDEIRDQFNELKADGVNYDCFLCVKVSDENGGTTQDSHEALRLYHHLKERGFHPFYSEEEIGSRTGSDYEALILYALYTSECMLLVCYDEEYLQTKWVKNEYTRFMAMIANEDKERDAITFVFKGKPIERLPGKSGKIQGIDLSRPDAYTRIDNFVESHTPEARAQREAEKSRKKREEEERSRQFEAMQQQLAESERRAKEEAERRRAEEEARNREREEMRAMIDELKRGNAPQQSAAPVGNLSPEQLLAMMRQAEEEEKKRKEEEERKKRAYFAQFEIENGVLKKYKGQGGDVIIPNNVTSIGEESFRDCSRLTSITIPDGVTSIGNRAFYNCSGLTNITIPNSVTSIGRSAFCACKILTSFIIPHGVTSIGNAAFDGCTGLTSIAIPASVTEIGFAAFRDCDKLKSVTIPNGVTAIGSCVFEGCSRLARIIIPNSATSIGARAFRGCDSLTSIVIPNSVTEIGESAFRGCGGLTSIVIPDGVTSIGKGTFDGCSGLTNITIPDSVTEIGNAAFRGCDKNASVTIHARWKSDITRIFGEEYQNMKFNFVDPNEAAKRRAKEEAERKKREEEERKKRETERLAAERRAKEEARRAYLAQFEIENGVLKKYKGKGGKVVIPTGVKTIRCGAFDDSSGLTSIEIPSSVNDIEKGAFNNCRNLKSVTIPKRFKGFMSAGLKNIFGEDYKNITFTFI